jgi:hypothetical protein
MARPGLLEPLGPSPAEFEATDYQRQLASADLLSIT